MDYEQIKRRVLDEEHLRLLAIFHFVYGGFTLVMALVMLMYTGIFSMFLSNPAFSDGSADVAMAGDIIGIFIGVFGVIAFLSFIYGIGLIVSGVLMRKRKARLFSFIMAIPNLIAIPWGTLLSVFTLIVLSRETVKSMYTAAQVGAPSSPAGE
ncbi:MAG TPA: hypothetical protein ENJ01_10695 [Gammaproteobacteria bacterium]|nr:hypothetical protein [Gammaproteobacteria bacterium]